MGRLKHTPGPWIREMYDEYLGYDCMYGGIRVGPIVLDGATYGQRSCQPIPSDGLDRMQCDALLIAAAPEMLQLLRDAWDAYMCDPNPQALTATMNKVEELLARLDGE